MQKKENVDKYVDKRSNLWKSEQIEAALTSMVELSRRGCSSVDRASVS